MEYEKSERTGFQERLDKDFPDGVHIRQADKGVMLYAVFDGEEQVSQTVGPLDEDYIINFAEGYSEGKRRYTD